MISLKFKKTSVKSIADFAFVKENLNKGLPNSFIVLGNLRGGFRPKRTTLCGDFACCRTAQPDCMYKPLFLTGG